MNTESLPSTTLAVADANASDYDAILSAAEATGLTVCFLPTGNDAMHFARRLQAGLWLVNTCLPDMSGFDLAQWLRQSRRRLRVFMIGDEYRLDDELQTLTLGLTKYVCKPVEPSWLLPFQAQPGVAATILSQPPSMADAIEDLLPVEVGGPAVIGSTEECVILPFVPRSRRPAA